MAAIKRKHGAVHDVELTADALQELAQAFLAVYREHTGNALPADPLRAARALDPGGVPVVERQARRRLPAAVPDHAGDGQRHGGQRLHDGVRQHGRRLGHRRRLHPQSGHRRERHLRRVPGECAGRGRRRRHPHAEADRRDGAGDARALPAARRAARQARGPLQGSAGLRVHDRARPALLPADPQRQDERAGDGDDVGRDVRGRADHEGPGAHAASTRSCSSSCSCRRSTRRTRRAAGAGPAGLAGRGVGQHRVRRGHGRRARQATARGRDPGARGDQARGHPRLLRRAGHPDQPRRQDLARGGRRARHGQALRLGLRRDRDRRARAPRDGRRHAAARGRRHHHRRLDRQRLSGADPDGRGRVLRRAGDAAGLGRRGGAAQGDGQCRHAARRRARPRATAPWASACAGPSACSTTRSGCRSCRR